MPMHQRHPERQAQRNRNDDRDSASAPEAVQTSSERTAYLQSVQRKAAGPLPSAPSVTDLLAQGFSKLIQRGLLLSCIVLFLLKVRALMEVYYKELTEIFTEWHLAGVHIVVAVFLKLLQQER